MHNPPADYRTVAALCDVVNAGSKHPTITEHALRHYVRHCDGNGLKPYVRRLGRKILVSESGFHTWLHEYGAKTSQSAA